MREITDMKIVKVGIVGIGNMGGTHLACIMDGKIEGMTVRAVCDIDADKLHAAKEKYPMLETYTDYKEMLTKADIDAAIIAVPHPLHAEVGIFAFAHGKHVLVEKPMDIALSAGERLCAAARESGKLFCIMLNQRTSPLFREARRLVQSGELGQLKRTVWVVTNWYRTDTYYASGAWRASWRGEGGGLLINQAAHNLDLWQWICGMPTALTAHCNVGRFHDIEVEDDAVLYAEFAGGATGVFISSTGDLPGTNRLEIVGTRGKVVIEGGKLKHWRLPTDERSICATSPESYPHVECAYTEITPERGSAHAGILQNFANALLHGETLISPGYDGLAQLTLINAAYLSAWCGSTRIALPFDTALYDRLLAEKAAHSAYKSEVKPLAADAAAGDRWQVNW